MSQYHILLVDDDEALRDLTKVALETLAGYRVSAYASGAQALRSAAGQAFDLLLLDVLMPEMDGIETLAALRQLPGLAAVPAVFLTARTQAQEIEAYRRYQVADVIAKPFDLQLLCERIQSVLLGQPSTAFLASEPSPDSVSVTAGEALVIEDDLSILYLVQFILGGHGYQVRSASNGNEGRAAIMAGPAAQAALVVLDLALPDEDGLQLLQRLRADARWDQVPVLVLSALRDEATMRQAFAAGADDYLGKPFDPHRMTDRIERLVKRGRSSGTEPAVTS